MPPKYGVELTCTRNNTHTRIVSIKALTQEEALKTFEEVREEAFRRTWLCNHENGRLFGIIPRRCNATVKATRVVEIGD